MRAVCSQGAIECESDIPGAPNSTIESPSLLHPAHPGTRPIPLPLPHLAGDGNVVIPDVDQDSGKDGDYVVEVSVDDDADADDHRLKELFRRHGVDALRAKVDGFFADVMAKAWA